MRRIIVALAVFVCMAVSAEAQTFIALVDLENRVLWIPEGTAVPVGVEFYLEPDEETVAGVERGRTQVAEAMAGGRVAAANAPARRQLVYAYAPAEKFTEARERIAESQRGEVEAQVADHDQWYYFYFYDGSYHAARKYILNIYDQNMVQFGTASRVYDVGGSYDTKATASRVSTQYSWLNDSKTCWFYAASGTCQTPLSALQTDPFYTGSVTLKGTLVRYLYAPCDTCKQNLSSSIVINFP